MGERVDLKTREYVIKILKNYRNSSCLLRKFEIFKPAKIYSLEQWHVVLWEVVYRLFGGT
jgi:hypothetical protein